MRDAVVRSRVVIALRVPAASRLRTSAPVAPQDGQPAFRTRFGHHRRSAGLLPAAPEFRSPSIRHHARFAAGRRQWIEPAAAISGDGDSSPDALSGICGLYRAFRLRAGGVDHALSGREMDPYNAPLDHGDLGLPDLWRVSRRPLGVLGAGVGRLLGLGSGRERVFYALADRDSISAFRNDAGKAWHAEDLERVADLLDIRAFNFWNFPHSQRRSQLGARFRAIFHRELVRCLSCDYSRGLHVFLREEPLASAQRTQTGIADLA